MKRTMFLAAAVALAAASAGASDPVGVYALIDRVVLEPGEGAPERIQIWGAFALAAGRPGDQYQPAQRGYLYYALDPAKQEICRKEWADLRSVAGTGQAIGFGGRYRSKGKLRQADERAEAPDTYPVGWGLVKVLSRHLGPQIEKKLKSAPKN